MKNPYQILGIDPSATFEEMEKRYNELKAEYGEGRFAPGEEGAEAARKLTELENAWREITSQNARVEKSEGAVDYEYIERLIKDGRFDDAQTVLDSITDRGAEWHYYQSIIYYQRDWLFESKKQLLDAINLDPENKKYLAALDRLNEVIGNMNSNPNNLGRDQVVSDTQPEVNGNALSNCCLAYCLASTCCDCMRCCM